MAKVCLVGDRTDGYRLEVDGAPFYVKGAGLEFGQLASLARAGGNAFRTWRVANGERSAEDILDEAQSLGLMVCMGLDMARRFNSFPKPHMSRAGWSLSLSTSSMICSFCKATACASE